MDGLFDRVFGRVELLGRLGVAADGLLTGDVGPQSLELGGSSGRLGVVGELCFDACDEGQCPLFFEQILGRDFSRGFESIALFGGIEIEREGNPAAAPFVCVSAVPIVDQEMFERGEQEGRP